MIGHHIRRRGHGLRKPDARGDVLWMLDQGYLASADAEGEGEEPKPRLTMRRLGRKAIRFLRICRRYCRDRMMWGKDYARKEFAAHVRGFWDAPF